MVEVRTVLEAQEMRMLLRGHIVLSVHAKRAPDVRLRGPFGPRIACDLFDSLVTAAEALPADEPSAANPSNVGGRGTSAAGLAWMYIGRAGSVHYRMKLRGFQSKVTRVTIESAGTSKPSKRPRVVEDVTDQLSPDLWINGTVSRLAAKDLELLYEGELYINVATEHWPTSEIRGKLVPRLAGESHLATDNGPVLLNPVGNGTGTNRAALGWVHVDNECNFHYDVAVTSSGSGGSSSRAREMPSSLTVLELVDIPRISIEQQEGGGIMLMDGSEPSAGTGSNYGQVPFMPNIRLLEEFSGYQVENSVGDLNKLSLARMDAGVAYLKLTEAPVIGSGSPGAQFQGWLTNVQVPGSCLPIGMGRSAGDPAEGSFSGVQGYVFDRAQDDNNEIPMATTRCFYEGKLYEDGRAWTAEHDRCMMCSCQRGKVVCDPVVCPALSCNGPNSAIIHPPGDCCPMCESKFRHFPISFSSSHFILLFSSPSFRCDESRDGIVAEGMPFRRRSEIPSGRKPLASLLASVRFQQVRRLRLRRKFCITLYKRNAGGLNSKNRLFPLRQPLTLKVECTKLTCPPLNCPESEAYRPDPMACCKQCPAAQPATTTTPANNNKDPAELDEQAQARGEVDILSSGGCRFKGDVFENGEEWHPRIQPWGEMRCINCNCKVITFNSKFCKKKKFNLFILFVGNRMAKSSASGRSASRRDAVEADRRHLPPTEATTAARPARKMAPLRWRRRLHRPSAKVTTTTATRKPKSQRGSGKGGAGPEETAGRTGKLTSI